MSPAAAGYLRTERLQVPHADDGNDEAHRHERQAEAEPGVERAANPDEQDNETDRECPLEQSQASTGEECLRQRPPPDAVAGGRVDLAGRFVDRQAPHPDAFQAGQGAPALAAILAAEDAALL